MRNPGWKIIHIGCLAQNKYWGEESVCRPQSCTTTLVETESRRILIDPGSLPPEEFQTLLFQRSGLRLEEIDTIFLTHFHPHHGENLTLFNKSLWLMSRVEIHWWQRRQETSESEQNRLARIVPIEDHPISGIEILPTSGHTHGHTSLIFETREGMVAAAGDAVLTFDHFDDREPSDHAEDHREARRSIDRIAKMADIVIPGHDNYFVV